MKNQRWHRIKDADATASVQNQYLHFEKPMGAFTYIQFIINPNTLATNLTIIFYRYSAMNWIATDLAMGAKAVKAPAPNLMQHSTSLSHCQTTNKYLWTAF